VGDPWGHLGGWLPQRPTRSFKKGFLEVKVGAATSGKHVHTLDPGTEVKGSVNLDRGKNCISFFTNL
jgi:hypothetical protein